MNTPPRLSIGVPVYNGGTMFVDMVNSLLSQTFTDFEIIICDNCSTDNTPQIAEDLVNADRRVKYHRNSENIGAAPNYNRTFELASKSTYFKWTAHDDIYAPTFLEKCIAALDAEPKAVVAYSLVDVIDETGEGLLEQHAQYARGCKERFRDEQDRPGWIMGPTHLAESADPAERFSEFLNSMIACFPIFGVMRKDVLHRTRLHKSYFGSDRTLLAELSLMGSFRQVDERLYVNRFHKTVSRLLSTKEQETWIDSKGISSIPAKWIQRRDLLSMPFTSGLSPVDAGRCFAVAAGHITRRSMGKAMRNAVHQVRAILGGRMVEGA
jgi:glycosyltransferase involved in cell wall biosynthesis